MKCVTWSVVYLVAVAQAMATRLCDWPDCVCRHISDFCQAGEAECPGQRSCTLSTNKPCCKVFKSCREISAAKDGVYKIKTDTVEGHSDVFCQMTPLSGCSGGGWTLVMKTDGNKETFYYGSSYWTNKEPFNLAGGLSGFDYTETKLPTYWSSPFTELCVGMRAGNDLKFISIDYTADSLYDVIADDNYHSTNVGREKWMSLISGSALQPHCSKEGFNVRPSGVHESARIGIVANEQNNCYTPDSFVGFGGSEAGDRTHCDQIGTTNTCGNIYSCGTGSDRNTRAMGYVFVR